VDEKNDQIAHHRIVAGRRNPKELWPKQQFASHTYIRHLWPLEFSKMCAACDMQISVGKNSE
jgi:hypothetical protein